jgi:replicative DNA helicase
LQITNKNSEEYIVSAMLNDPESVITSLAGDGITSSSFHLIETKMLYNMISKRFKEGKLHSIELLEEEPDVVGRGEDLHLPLEISRIRVQYCGIEVLEQHIAEVKRNEAMRLAYRVATDALAVIETCEDPQELAEAFRRGSESIVGTLEGGLSWKNSEQALAEFTEMLQNIHNNKDDGGSKSGIYPLDNVTGGLHVGEMWVIAAPTSGGKTVLMFQIAANFINNQKNVLVFSLETEADRIHARISANTMSVDMSKILGTNGTPLDKNAAIKLRSYIEKQKDSPHLKIVDQDSITLETIMSVSKQAESTFEGGIDMIVVDYLQLISLTNAAGMARHEQIAEISRSLKQLAKRHGCCVLTASQLNDDGKVRESRAISHDADVLLKIDPKNEVVHVSKNRNGERGGQLKMKMVGEYQRFDTYN